MSFYAHHTKKDRVGIPGCCGRAAESKGQNEFESITFSLLIGKCLSYRDVSPRPWRIEVCSLLGTPIYHIIGSLLIELTYLSSICKHGVSNSPPPRQVSCLAKIGYCRRFSPIQAHILKKQCRISHLKCIKFSDAYLVSFIRVQKQ